MATNQNYVYMDEDVVKEFLSLANKPPSPRSVTATSNLGDEDVTTIKHLVNEFLVRVVGLTLINMQHFWQMTIHPRHVSNALEYFVKFDVIRYRHSYMLDTSQDSEESDQCEWEENDAQEEIFHEDDDYLHESSDDNFDNDSDSDDYSETDDGDSDEQFWSESTVDMNSASTPTFDAIFEPVEGIKLSNNSFLQMFLRPVLNERFRSDLVSDEEANEILKNAMYAYVVAKIK